MFRLLKKAWSDAWSQPFLLVALFLYRFAWAFALFRIVKSHVLPVLARYPDAGGPAGQSQLFVLETQFRLGKTDLAEGYLYGLLLLLAIRMLLTPLLNAGVFYSLVHTRLNTGYRFFKGIKSLGPAFFLYYAAQMALTLVPLIWLLPKVHTLGELNAVLSDPKAYLLYALAYAVYGYAVHLLFLHLQFGKTDNRPLPETLLRAFASLLPAAGAALLLLLLSGLLSAGVLTVTLWDAGLWTFLLYQAFSFVRTFLSLWGLTAQHGVFLGRAERS